LPLFLFQSAYVFFQIAGFYQAYMHAYQLHDFMHFRYRQVPGGATPS